MTSFKNYIAFICLFGCCNASIAQQVQFENITTNQGFYNGSDQAGGFESEGIHFKNTYNTQFDSWSGFGVSNLTDTINGTYSNQYSSYAGSGAAGSNQFGIVYVYEPAILKPASNTTQALKLGSIQFTNSTWTGLSMKNGDAFSKKFGGPTGNDPDYFRIRIFNHFNGEVTDSALVYLADFRFSDNSQDYIVKNWKLAEINFTHAFDSISFQLESSDVGQFGMNTPAYFCLDNITFLNPSSVSIPEVMDKHIYPNPFENELQITNNEVHAQVAIYTCAGQLVLSENLPLGKVRINTSALKPGVYFVKAGNKPAGIFTKL